jgi:hypothetical protein
MHVSARLVVAIVVLLVVIAGCSSGPARVEAPAWDPDDFADAVLSKLDANGDEALDQSELAGAPGLAAGAKPIDADQNEALSRDELVARFTTYRDMRLGLTTKQVLVTYKRRPLVGATVKLVPEFFLESLIEAAEGETGPDGVADPRIPNLDALGLRVGYYRVVVESPTVRIPAKYGSPASTDVGVEIPPYSNDPATAGIIQLTLKD